VTPLEVWEHSAGDTNLWEGRDRSDWPDLVRAVALEIARRERMNAVVITGGGAPRLSGVFPSEAIVPDPFFPASAGAGLVSSPDAHVIDVGQTSLKVVHRARRVRLERPGLVRPGPGPSLVRPTTLGPLFAEARAFASGVPLVVALPCALDDTCEPGPCTYADVAEVLRSLDPGALVLNDAELAAHAARAAGLVPPEGALVLTVGFGIGAALVRHE
jgi:hypothetical protein